MDRPLSITELELIRAALTQAERYIGAESHITEPLHREEHTECLTLIGRALPVVIARLRATDRDAVKHRSGGK